MNTRRKSSAQLCVLCVLIALCAVVQSKENVVEFKVVPNKDGSVSVALDTPPIPSSTCTFEWTSNGATTELWEAKVSGDPRTGDLACDISRKGGAETYLFFTKFRTTLGTNPVLEAAVHGNDGELEDGHLETDGECVMNSQEWSGGTVRSISLKSIVIG